MVIEKSVEVVLPTYNGVLYLEDQIKSIYCQTVRPQNLFIRDDCSTDGTQDLLASLSNTYGSWLHVSFSRLNHGCIETVNRLLVASNAEFVAIADQDDIWHLDKIEVLLHKAHQLRDHYGYNVPFLIHTNLHLVDSLGNSLKSDFISKQRLNVHRTSFEDLCITNNITGCTVLLNRSLLKQSLPIPDQALMHDWWLALCCSQFGQISYISRQLVYYRQHDNNVLGASGFSFKYFSSRLLNYIRNPANKHILYALRIQQEAFNAKFELEKKTILNLIDFSRAKRIFFIIKYLPSLLTVKHGPIRSFLFIIILAICPIATDIKDNIKLTNSR